MYFFIFIYLPIGESLTQRKHLLLAPFLQTKSKVEVSVLLHLMPKQHFLQSVDVFNSL